MQLQCGLTAYQSRILQLLNDADFADLRNFRSEMGFDPFAQHRSGEIALRTIACYMNHGNTRVTIELDQFDARGFEMEKGL